MKRIFALALSALLLLLSVPAHAQQPKKVPRIGYLSSASPSAGSSRIEAFRQGLRDLGYVEGRTWSLSGDLQKENSIASPRSRLS